MADARVALALGLSVFALFALDACASAPPPEPPPPPRVLTAPLPAVIDFQDVRWGEFRSKRFRLSVEMPDGHAWKIDDHSLPWLIAKHGASPSELAVRIWAEEERANTKTCEARARSWRTLPERAGADVVEHQPVGVPRDFDTEVDVGVLPPARAGGEIRGFVLAFGGRRHTCFAYVFTTAAEGAGAEKIVGLRLAAMVSQSLRKIAVEDELNPQVHTPPPTEPKRVAPPPTVGP